ncbi:MAG: 3-dehydroquinate dehydratase [Bacteroidetes bacterium]|nr:3-dehydroquinate dehydratase [Bacteroidota bacterium]
MQLAIIQGPNLNLLGIREPEIYGSENFEAFFESLKKEYPNHEFALFQSNMEGEIINYLQEKGLDGKTDGIILNAGGYSHTSVAIADAIRAIPVKVVCVHISNTHAREAIRNLDLAAAAAKGAISGLGLSGYRLAVEYFLNQR